MSATAGLARYAARISLTLALIGCSGMTGAHRRLLPHWRRSRALPCLLRSPRLKR